MSLFSTPSLNEKRKGFAMKSFQTESLAVFFLFNSKPLNITCGYVFLTRVAKYLNNQLKIGAIYAT
jgi:hypothetical protein